MVDAARMRCSSSARFMGGAPRRMHHRSRASRSPAKGLTCRRSCMRSDGAVRAARRASSGHQAVPPRIDVCGVDGPLGAQRGRARAPGPPGSRRQRAARPRRRARLDSADARRWTRRRYPKVAVASPSGGVRRAAQTLFARSYFAPSYFDGCFDPALYRRVISFVRSYWACP